MRQALSERSLSYEAIGATAVATAMRQPPSGYLCFERSVRLGAGAAHWDLASDAVLRWGIKTRSGFSVRDEGGSAADGSRVAPDHRYWLVAYLGPVRIKEPVQVISVVDDLSRKGFAYGTLSGHPVSGEEAFIVDRHGDGSVWLTLRSITRPSNGLWRALFPALRLAQWWYRRRYLRALVDGTRS